MADDASTDRPRRVLVCGGRNFICGDIVVETLKRLNPSVVIEGGSRGADTYAGLWANCCGIERVTFRADWATHGKAAGPIRNQKMLDEGVPDLVVAFPGGRGTADMVARATKAGVPCLDLRTS